MRSRRPTLSWCLLALLLATCGHAAPEGPQAAKAPLRLGFVGDLMAHSVNYAVSDYSRAYEGVRDLLLADDLTFANLEMVLDPSLPRSSYPRFNNHPDYLQAALDAGIEVLSLANNHSFDYGEAGVRATLRSLEALARRQADRSRLLQYNGVRAKVSEAWAPTEIRIKGWSIGFIALTQFSNEPGAESLVRILDYRDEETRRGFLSELEGLAPRYDLLVVSYHGDEEYAREPDPARKEFFHAMLDRGATIVYGHHPHVVQACELVERRGEKGLILYSTGNFLAGQSVRADPLEPDGPWARTGDTMVFQVTVRPGNPRASVVRVDLVPRYHHRRPPDGRVVIDSLENMARASGVWGAFYRARLELARQYIERNPVREPRHFAP